MSRAFQVPGPATWLGIVVASVPLLVIDGICLYYAPWRAVAIASGILAVMWGLWSVLLRVAAGVGSTDYPRPTTWSEPARSISPSKCAVCSVSPHCKRLSTRVHVTSRGQHVVPTWTERQVMPPP